MYVSSMILVGSRDDMKSICCLEQNCIEKNSQHNAILVYLSQKVVCVSCMQPASSSHCEDYQIKDIGLQRSLLSKVSVIVRVTTLL